METNGFQWRGMKNPVTVPRAGRWTGDPTETTSREAVGGLVLGCTLCLA